ncbi:damage-inducible type I toxin DinQ [Escherichia coli]
MVLKALIALLELIRQFIE